MKVQHSVVNNNKLNTVPVTNGQIVYVKDTHDLYFDVDNTRTKATDIIFVATLQERDNIQSPLPDKVYCVEENNKFYRYENNDWVIVGYEEQIPQVFLWDYSGRSIGQNDITFWNNVLLANDVSDVIVLYDLSQNGIILRIFKGDLRKNKRTEYGYTTSISNQTSYSTYTINRVYVTVTITNDIITAVNLSQTSSDKSFTYLAPNNNYGTPYVPLYAGSPATKKYVDDNCIPYQPFPAGLDTSHTTQEFITSIRALNLPAGSTYLGGVTLTDMPFNGNAEVEIYVYPNNVIYLVLRSANVSPYIWECNSHTYRGWEAVGKAYTDNTISTSVIETGSTTPTTSTVGNRIGQIYLNTTDNSVYQLTAIDDTDPNAIVYTWQQLVTTSYLTTALNNFTPASTDTSFDNTGTDMSSTNVEDAIIELNNKIGSLNTLIEEINGE